jgi:hypothetical protein
LTDEFNRLDGDSIVLIYFSERRDYCFFFFSPL